MIRFLLLSILLTLAIRMFWRLVDGAIEGYTGQPRGRRGSSGVPAKAVPMVRDPVCGTFVVPASAVSLSEPGGLVYFCSDRCRDQYRARPSASSGRPERVEGRIA
jgi:YHS domain-containing protein